MVILYAKNKYYQLIFILFWKRESITQIEKLVLESWLRYQYPWFKVSWFGWH